MADNDNLELQSRKYLQREMDGLHCQVVEKLRDTYNINDMLAPKTPREMRERINQGLFEITGEDSAPDKSFGWGGPGLRWRDPAKKADHEGYNKAADEYESEFSKVMTKLFVLPSIEGLKIYENFRDKWLK